MMRKNILIIIVACCLTGLMWSCSKSSDNTAATIGTDGYAFLKVSQFAPNFRGVFNNRDSFNVYVNNAKFTGAYLTFNSTYPTVSNLYATVPAGASTIKLLVVGTTGLDSVVVATLNKTFTAGGYYSLLITDSILNVSDSKQIFVQDNFVRSDTTHYTIRFAHTILSDTAGKTVDVYSNRLKTNIFSNISPGTVTPFVAEPYNFISDTLIVRRSGTNFELARVPTVATPLARERAYTLSYKGLPATTTGTKARSLVYYPNQ